MAAAALLIPRGSGSPEGAKSLRGMFYELSYPPPPPPKWLNNVELQTFGSLTPPHPRSQECTFRQPCCREPQRGTSPLRRRESTTPSGVIVFVMGGTPSQNFQNRFGITRFQSSTFPGTRGTRGTRSTQGTRSTRNRQITAIIRNGPF